MNDDFDKRKSELLRSDGWNGFLGIHRGAQYHTKAGVSSQISEVYFLEDISEEELEELPDYILSDTLQKDIESSVVVCAWGLKGTKYLPSDVSIGGKHGAIPEGEREGAYIEGWEDYTILGVDGTFLYTEEVIESAVKTGETPLGAAMWLVVKDICDSGGFLSLEWYRARIVYEYFRNYPIELDSAYLIGELFKELCTKQQFEGDLKSYYQGLIEVQEGRKKGARKIKQKAEELRQFCVTLFVELHRESGPRLLMAPDDVKAEELRKAALSTRPSDFQRAGEPYRKEWFLRNIIEDRRLEIMQALEESSARNP